MKGRFAPIVFVCYANCENKSSNVADYLSSPATLFEEKIIQKSSHEVLILWDKTHTKHKKKRPLISLKKFKAFC